MLLRQAGKMKYLKKLFILTTLFCFSISYVRSQSQEKNVAVIFDTDIGPDYDDVGALAMLHALADRKECSILATIACNRYSGVASVLNVLNTYFGRPNIPIGVAGNGSVSIPALHNWDSLIIADYQHLVKKNEKAEDAVQLYRRMLSGQDNKSVTIISVGFFTNLANLLESAPDKYSPLSGRELVKKKVKKLVSMAGRFDSGQNNFKEYNILKDTLSSAKVFEEWPTEIIFSGFEIGNQIYTGRALVRSNIQASPVKDVYAWCFARNNEYESGRMSWDQTAVLVGIRGISDYYTIQKGRITSTAGGGNKWNFRKKGHAYLIEKMSVEKITALIEDLMMHQPLTGLSTNIHLKKIVTPGSRSESAVSFREYTVFDGNKGFYHNGIMFRLACGPTLTVCANGDLLCTWLSGSGVEPASDNGSLMSRSRDGGRTWSTPRLIAPATDMAGMLTNIRVTSDNKLTAYHVKWPSDKLYTEWFYTRIQSSDHGYTWSDSTSFAVRKNNHNYAIGSPLQLSNGTYLYSGMFFDKREKPLTGPIHLLAQPDQTEQNIYSMSEMTKNDEVSMTKFGQYRHGCNVLMADSDTSIHFTESGYIGNRPLGLLEPSMVQLKDGRVVMLMRAEWGGFLWRSESADNGKTWSSAIPTDIPNPTSLANLIRLPDGRIGLIHNPSGEVGKFGLRSPLSLWISDDEMENWSVKADLISTQDYLAYPFPVIYNDTLVFAYDKNRREIKFVEIFLQK